MTDEATLAAERGIAVANAVKAGKIPLDAAPEWLARLKANPDAAKHFNNMAAGYRPPESNPLRQALRTSPPPLEPPQERQTRQIVLGGGMVQMEAQLIGGKTEDQWTPQEQMDAITWKLGPRFRKGLKPPPEPNWYIPTDQIPNKIQ